VDKTNTEIKNLKPNGFVMIDDAPCRVEKVQVSSSGKHGHSKVRVDALGLLDGTRRSMIKPADDVVDVPIVVKKKAQVLAIVGNKAQIMDMSDYNTFELDIPEERREDVKQGEEIDYFEVCDIKTLKQLK
jgi:translation initiation factor 5A